MTLQRKRTSSEANWRMLLELCRKYGKDEVIKKLEKSHATYESWEASAWADPATYPQARRLQQRCLRQDETLIRLRQMTDDDVARSLKEGKLITSGQETGGGHGA